MEIRELSFSYGDRPVLEKISFSVDYGQFLSVLGANGAGKSTLFRCMLGLLPPKKGSILLDGTDISAFIPQQLAGKLAYIPQSHTPVFSYSVLDMVLMGTACRSGRFSAPGIAQQKIAQESLQKLGIGHLQDRSYCAISGGERQLVLIARAMAQQARILIMDEPTASLDAGNSIRVMQTAKMLTEQGYAVIQSTHDAEQAYLYSQRILALQNGRALALGTPQEVITEPVMQKLYGSHVQVCSLQNDRVRVCVPKER